MQQWVSVEGIIGARKTTLIQAIAPLLAQDTCIVEEPVEAWQKSGILERAYADPKTYNFPAQCEFFVSRIKTFERAYKPNTSLFLSERCAFTDMLFWNTQLDLDRVDPLLHSIYLGMWGVFQRLMPLPNPTLFVYLRPPMDVCMESMRQRGRSEESSVDVEYQQVLLKRHDDAFMDPNGVMMPNGQRVPCVVLETSDNFRDDPEVAARIAAQIKNHLP